jgi:pre-mRNA-splicing factor RBM22/SLT11
VCSFFLKGNCQRGKLCPYRHELGHEKDGKDITQSIRDRFHGINDPVARKIMGQVENSTYVRAPKDSGIRTLVIYFLEEKHGERLR